MNRLTGLLLPRREAERTADRLIHQARDESSLVWDGIRRGVGKDWILNIF